MPARVVIPEPGPQGPPGPAGPQGPEGPPGPTMVIEFGVDDWGVVADGYRLVVTHDMDRYPAVDVVDSAGSAMGVAYDYPNAATVNIYAKAIFGGKVFLN